MSRVGPTRAASSATAGRAGEIRRQGFESFGIGHLGVIEPGQHLQ